MGIFLRCRLIPDAGWTAVRPAKRGGQIHAREENLESIEQVDRTGRLVDTADEQSTPVEKESEERSKHAGFLRPERGCRSVRPWLLVAWL